MTAITKVGLLPQKPVTRFGVADRAMGRLAKMDVVHAPKSEVEADLAGDTFSTVYRDAEMVADAPQGREVNKALLDFLRGNSAWSPMLETARGDVLASMTAASAIYEYLRTDEATSAALKAQAEADAKQEEADALEHGAQAAEQAADALEEAGNDVDAAQLRRQAQAQRQQAQAASEAATQAQADATARAGKAAGSAVTKALATSAIKDADAKAKEVAGVAAGFGRGRGDLSMADAAQAQKVLQAMTPKIKRIAKLAGRLRGIGFEARRNMVKRGEEPADLEFTQDFGRMFPTEMALLSQHTDPLNRLRVMQWSESGLAGWKMVEREKERGPFVAGVDVSGSMSVSAGSDYTREEVGKAVALGVAQVAQSEDRPYRLFSFSSREDELIECDSTQGWPQHLTWAGATHRGGTDFDIALANAIAHLDAMGEDGHQADLLFVSDGDATIAPATTQAWKEFQARTGSRLLYVAVAGTGRRFDQLERLADMVIDVAELNAEAGDILAKEVSVLM